MPDRTPAPLQSLSRRCCSLSRKQTNKNKAQSAATNQPRACACVRVYARVLVPPNLYIHTNQPTNQ